MTAEQYIQKLIELSTKKLTGLKEILSLTVTQSSVIAEDNADELQRIIDLKQQQMNMIDELDDAFNVYYSRLKSLLGVQSIEEIKMTQLQGSIELKNIITTIFETIKKIQAIESENNNMVKAIIAKLSQDIKQVNQAKMVNNGYNVGAKLPQQSYYIDKKK